MKKVSTLTGTIIIFVAIAILFGGVFAYQYFSNPQQNSKFFGSSQKTNQTQNQATGWKTYKNDEYGFEFKYADGAFDYSIDPQSKCETLAANSNNSFSCKLILGNIDISKDFNKMRIKIVYTNSENYLSSPLSDTSLTTIGNIKGHEIGYSLSKLKPAVYERVFYVKVGDNTMEIGFPVDTNKDSDRKPLDVSKIISTFKFTK